MAKILRLEELKVNPEENKKVFCDIFKQNVHREGSDKLLEYLEKSDFFTAPASTVYHGNYCGGLCEHSLHVYDCLKDIVARERIHGVYGQPIYSEETLAIVALLHDLCKAGFYAECERNVKKGGAWVRVPAYRVEDQLPFGHGEKSVYMASGFMRLTREEAIAIRFHMGFSEETCDRRNVGNAFAMYPLAFFLHMADEEATLFLDATVDPSL